MSARNPVSAAVVLALSASLAAAGVARASELEDRVTRIEGLMQSQGLIDMLTQLQQLQRELQQLRGEVETQGNQLRQMQEQQRTLYLDIDRRLQQAGGALPGAVPAAPGAAAVAPPPGGGVAPGVAGSGTAGSAAMTPSAAATTLPPGAAAPAPGAVAPSPGMPATTPATPVAPAAPGLSAAAAPVPQAATASPDEQAAYEQALNILREGRYADAAAAYRQFLQTYPNGRYADNAQYWLAETQYVTRQFPQALEEFGKVVNGYTNSVKAPDALLKIGYIQYELGDWKAARESLQAVRQRFPDSTAARLAGERLQRMDREGR